MSQAALIALTEKNHRGCQCFDQAQDINKFMTPRLALKSTVIFCAFGKTISVSHGFSRALAFLFILIETSTPLNTLTQRLFSLDSP